MHHPRLIGHRGMAMMAPENTLAGIHMAHRQHIRWVEVDVQLSAEGKPYLLHDATFARTAGLAKAPHQLASKRIDRLDVGAWYSADYIGEAPPSLVHALKLCQILGMSMNIELKPYHNDPVALTLAVAASVLQQPEYQHRVLISSFQCDSLQLLKRRHPTIQRGYLVNDSESGPQILDGIRRLEPFSVHLPTAQVSAALLAKIKHLGPRVYCFTVNQPARARSLFNMGIDAVFSDLPLLLD